MMHWRDEQKISKVNYIKRNYENTTVKNALKSIDEALNTINFSEIYGRGRDLIVNAKGKWWVSTEYKHEPDIDEAVLPIDSDTIANIISDLPYNDETGEYYVTEKEDFVLGEVFSVSDLALGDALEGDCKTLLENMIEKYTKGLLISEHDYSECSLTREELEELGVKIVDRYPTEWDKLSEG